MEASNLTTFHNRSSKPSNRRVISCLRQFRGAPSLSFFKDSMWLQWRERVVVRPLRSLSPLLSAWRNILKSSVHVALFCPQRESWPNNQLHTSRPSRRTRIWLTVWSSVVTTWRISSRDFCLILMSLLPHQVVLCIAWLRQVFNWPKSRWSSMMKLIDCSSLVSPIRSNRLRRRCLNNVRACSSQLLSPHRSKSSHFQEWRSTAWCRSIEIRHCLINSNYTFMSSGPTRRTQRYSTSWERMLSKTSRQSSSVLPSIM